MNLLITSNVCLLILFPSLLLSIVYLQVRGKDFKFKEHLLLLLNLLLLILIRIPYVLENNELNVDESGLMGQAIGIKNGLYIWQDIHPSTAGPINTYIYYWFTTLTNMPINYISVHLLSLILDICTISVLYFSGKYLFNKKRALFALPLIIILWNLGNSPKDMYHYASEKFSLVIIAVLLFLVLKQFRSKDIHFAELFVSGFLIALVPFAKPQGIVIAGVIGLFHLGYSIYTEPQQKLKSFAAIAAGATFFLSIILCYIISIDGWATFKSQIKLITTYSSHLNLFAKIAYFNTIPGAFKENTLALIFSLVLASALYSYKKLKSIYGLYTYLFVVVASLISIYTVIKPGTFFVHYFHYLIPFLFYLIVFTTTSKTEVIPLAIAVIVIFNYLNFDKSHSIFNNAESLTKATTMKTTVLGSYINRLSKPTDKIAIWGWTSGYYTETRLPQAVLFNDVAFLVIGAYQDLFRREFFKGIKTNKPAFFLDTSVTTSAINIIKIDSPEKVYPELAKYIRTNYTVIKNDNGDRLFVRNDRLPKEI